MIPIERTHEYRGLYHVLGGALSPIDGVDPEDLQDRRARRAGSTTARSRRSCSRPTRPRPARRPPSTSPSCCAAEVDGHPARQRPAGRRRPRARRRGHARPRPRRPPRGRLKRGFAALSSCSRSRPASWWSTAASTPSPRTRCRWGSPPIIPRVFQRDWGRVSKHVVELQTYPAATVPEYGTTTDIPCVLLHLPCYVRSLPPIRRLDTPSGPPGAEWHREQAEHVRGLS